MAIAALIGFLFGFFGSIPVAGPISALVLSRGVQGRFRSGAYIAVGGGLTEAAYAYVAFWGFATYLQRYPWIEPASRLAAAVILVALGISFTRYRLKAHEPTRDDAGTALSSFALGVTITALNPTLIATWTGVAATLFSTELIDMSSAQATPFAGGVCLGIAGWFLVLLELIRRHRGRFDERTLERVVRVIGGLLVLLGGYFAFRFVSYLSTGA